MRHANSLPELAGNDGSHISYTLTDIRTHPSQIHGSLLFFRIGQTENGPQIVDGVMRHHPTPPPITTKNPPPPPPPPFSHFQNTMTKL